MSFKKTLRAMVRDWKAGDNYLWSYDYKGIVVHEGDVKASIERYHGFGDDHVTAQYSEGEVLNFIKIANAYDECLDELRTAFHDIRARKRSLGIAVDVAEPSLTNEYQEQRRRSQGPMAVS